jgi:FkbM family methyltransferase
VRNRLVSWGARRLGIARRRPGTLDPHWRRAKAIEGAQISLVVDVGAHTGAYGQAIRDHTSFIGPIVSFEPAPTAFVELSDLARRDGRWTCVNAALSDRRGSATLQIPVEQPLLASLLPAREGPFADAASGGLSEVQVAVVTLDEGLAGILKEDDRVLLKIDVQGLELSVLRGATTALSRVELVECELPLSGGYEGQASLRDIVDFMDDIGLRPIGVEPNWVDPHSGRMMDADFLFART